MNTFYNEIQKQDQFRNLVTEVEEAEHRILTQKEEIKKSTGLQVSVNADFHREALEEVCACHMHLEASDAKNMVDRAYTTLKAFYEDFDSARSDRRGWFNRVIEEKLDGMDNARACETLYAMSENLVNFNMKRNPASALKMEYVLNSIYRPGKKLLQRPRKN